MTRYPGIDDVLAVGRMATGAPVAVRDTGLLLAALARPQQTVFGADAYGSDWEKAAALLHSFTRNHALVDGNKRTGLALAWTFLVINEAIDGGFRDVEDGLALTLEVAQGKLDAVEEITRRLQLWLQAPQTSVSRERRRHRNDGLEPLSPDQRAAWKQDLREHYDDEADDPYERDRSERP